MLVVLFVAISPDRLKGSKSAADAAVRDLRKRRRENMGLWVHGFMGLRVYGFMGLWVYGFMSSRVYGFTGLWVYGFTGSWVMGLRV
jgi:hypothetical protein